MGKEGKEKCENGWSDSRQNQVMNCIYSEVFCPIFAFSIHSLLSLETKEQKIGVSEKMFIF